ncbi:MAG: metallophosphoesterase [Armatimonadetes bacterium]|nr:metallophosphoesterase [Armatimonadota bacterium]
MNWKRIFWGSVGIGGGMLAYGALVEARRLVVDRVHVPLDDWPSRLNGFRIAVLGDFHVSGRQSAVLARRAVELALDELPDMVCLVGDFVRNWKPSVIPLLGDVLEPLLAMEGSVVAVPGNHDYEDGQADLLYPIMDELNIRLLRNETWRHLGIDWVGIDSFVEGYARPEEAFKGAKQGPRVVLWHEPDLVWRLPEPASLQLSGHSHGGQFVFPGGWAPMHTKHGERYVDGFYPEAPTPIFVTRGVGTTFLPSRFLCPPQVAILTVTGRDAIG